MTLSKSNIHLIAFATAPQWAGYSTHYHIRDIASLIPPPPPFFFGLHG